MVEQASKSKKKSGLQETLMMAAEFIANVGDSSASSSSDSFTSYAKKKKKYSFRKFQKAKKSEWDEIPPSKSSDKTRKRDTTNTEDSSNHSDSNNNDNCFGITRKKIGKHSQECCDVIVELINYDGELVTARGLLDSGFRRSVLLKPFVHRKRLKRAGRAKKPINKPTKRMEAPSWPKKQLGWIFGCQSFPTQGMSDGNSVWMKSPIQKQQLMPWSLVQI